MTNQLIINAPDGVPWVEFTREFDAPAAAVFNAHRDPDLARRWYGPDTLETTIDRHEFAPGGRYRYVQRDSEGVEYGFHGVFHTVRDDDLIVQTFEYEGAPDQVLLEFLHFESLPGGRSRLHGRSTAPSVEARDAMIESGMEHGMKEGYDRLERLCSQPVGSS